MSVPQNYQRTPSEQYFLFSYTLRQRSENAPDVRQACISGLESVRALVPSAKMKLRIEGCLAA